MTATPALTPDVSDFVDRIDQAASLGSRDEICQEVKSALKDLVARELEDIPAGFFVGAPDSYARRLLFQCPNKTYSAIVMMWQPGQGTPIHDHGGNWCVECVLKGSIEVVGFDPVGDPATECGFQETKRERAVPGDVGILVPPNEYHSITNVAEEKAVTIHIYEGEMLWCHTFEEVSPGAYRPVKCDLSYTE